MHPNAKRAYYFDFRFKNLEVQERKINPYTPVNRWVSEVGYYAFIVLSLETDRFFLTYTEDFKEALLRKKDPHSHLTIDVSEEECLKLQGKVIAFMQNKN